FIQQLIHEQHSTWNIFTLHADAHAVAADDSFVPYPVVSINFTGIAEAEGYISSFDFAFVNQNAFSLPEVPLLVEHSQYTTGGNNGQVVVIVSGECFGIDQALLVCFVKFSVILLCIILVLVNFDFEGAGF